MANWLDKALGKQETTVEETVPYELTCVCGTGLSGLRQQRAKRVICAQCGEAHFILPANQYPTSDRVYFSRSEEAAAAPVDLDSTETDEIEFESLDAGSSDPPAGGSYGTPRKADESKGKSYKRLEPEVVPLPGLRQRTEPRRPKLPKPGPAIDKPAPEREFSRVELPDEDSEQARTRRRLAFVGGVFGLICIGMFVWVMRSQSRDRAEIRLTESIDRGLQALESGDFLTARRELGAALESMELLDADEKRITDTRRKWLEAYAATSLLDGSVIEVVEAAQRAAIDPADELSVERWRREFNVHFGDRWLLIDQSPLMTVPGVDGVSGTRLLYPWQLEDSTAEIHISGLSAQLRSLQGQGDASRIIFAGKMIDCRRESGATDAWVLELDPESAFLWVRFKSLVQLGLADAESVDVRRQIRIQAEVVGVDPPSETEGTASEERFQ